MAGPPGTSAWPAMIYCEAALGVMTELPIESKGRRVADIGPDVSGRVLLPMTRPDAEGAREMRVPEMVIAGAPGISVWLSIRYWEAVLGSIVIPFMVSGGSWVALAIRGIVVPPMTMPDADGARLIGVPEIVMAGAPGISVWLSIRYWEAVLGSIVIPFMVSGGSWVALAIRGIVVPPMTMPDADGARLIGVPEIVMAGAPAIIVWLPITYSEALLGKTVFPPIVRAGDIPSAVAKGTVLPSTA